MRQTYSLASRTIPCRPRHQFVLLKRRSGSITPADTFGVGFQHLPGNVCRPTTAELVAPDSDPCLGVLPKPFAQTASPLPSPGVFSAMTVMASSGTPSTTSWRRTTGSRGGTMPSCTTRAERSSIMTTRLANPSRYRRTTSSSGTCSIGPLLAPEETHRIRGHERVIHDQPTRQQPEQRDMKQNQETNQHARHQQSPPPASPRWRRESWRRLRPLDARDTACSAGALAVEVASSFDGVTGVVTSADNPRSSPNPSSPPPL